MEETTPAGTPEPDGTAAPATAEAADGNASPARDEEWERLRAVLPECREPEDVPEPARRLAEEEGLPLADAYLRFLHRERQRAAEERERMLTEAREQAAGERARLVAEARAEAGAEREAILRDARQQVALLAVAVTEKMLRCELQDKTSQTALAERLLDEIERPKNRTTCTPD